MVNRRKFLLLGALGLGSTALEARMPKLMKTPGCNATKPIVLSTWDFGMRANARAWEILSSGGTALDAVEAGVMVIESDFTNRSVGLGGSPDRDGHTTLDACIMDHLGRAGSVCFLEHIEHPISLARRVMEKTPHVMLVGEGAFQFAMEEGFEKKVLPMPEDTKKAWEEWQIEKKYAPVINIENHDTIGMVALDSDGNLSGSCTTSGMAWKMHGRVGDSPIIGAGLFVDNEIGAAAATGHGEFVLRTCGSHTVVELMRQGYSPAKACKLTVERIIQKYPNDLKNIQVGYIAINKKGESGGYCIHSGFNYALRTKTEEKLVSPPNFMP